MEIICDLIEAADKETKESSDREGGCPTYIMNRAHMSGEQFYNHYLPLAIRTGFLEEVDIDGKKRYKPTTKGIKFSKNYRRKYSGLLK